MVIIMLVGDPSI